MGYVAHSEGFCKKDDIEDEWKIPIDAHNKALAYLEEKKIVTGRDAQRKKTKKEKHKEQQENDTAEILELLKDKYTFITTDDTKTIYYYKDGVYEEAERLIETEVERHFNITNSTYFTHEIINHLRRESYTSRDIFNTDKTRIPLKNGLFNIETFELEEFDKNNIFNFRFPITYDADAVCPNIEAWITQIVSEDSFALFQEVCGYGFEPSFPLHIALWMHGAGRNGKGAFMRLYKKLIGKNGSSIPLEQVSAKYRFALIGLLNSFVNDCSEPQSNYVFQTETFKKITGADEIEGEIKGLQKKINFTSFAKFFIMGNKYPTIEDDTTGFWERMVIVKFPHDYSKEFIVNIEDKKIEEDGGEDKALAGFFNWCMVGLKRLKKSGYKITESKSSEDTRLEFEKISNSIRAFITECVVLKPSERYPQPDLWNEYKNYCDQFGLEIHQKSIFTTRIGELRGVTRKSAKAGKKTQRVWFGLSFKPCDDEEDQEEEEETEMEASQKKLTELTKLTDLYTCQLVDKFYKKNKNIERDIIGEYIAKMSTLTTSTTQNEKPIPIEIKKFARWEKKGKKHPYCHYTHYEIEQITPELLNKNFEKLGKGICEGCEKQKTDLWSVKIGDTAGGYCIDCIRNAIEQEREKKEGEAEEAKKQKKVGKKQKPIREVNIDDLDDDGNIIKNPKPEAPSEEKIKADIEDAKRSLEKLGLRESRDKEDSDEDNEKAVSEAITEILQDDPDFLTRDDEDHVFTVQSKLGENDVAVDDATIVAVLERERGANGGVVE